MRERGVDVVDELREGYIRLLLARPLPSGCTSCSRSWGRGQESRARAWRCEACACGLDLLASGCVGENTEADGTGPRAAAMAGVEPSRRLSNGIKHPVAESEGAESRAVLMKGTGTHES